MRKGMRVTPGSMQVTIPADQTGVKRMPFGVFVARVVDVVCIVCVCIAAVVHVVSIMNFETDAHAPVSLCKVLLSLSLFASLTLTGLARLIGLQSLVGLTRRLATNTA
jgi:hypothetical protein